MYQVDAYSNLLPPAAVIPSVKLLTTGSRAFPAAATKIWNALPDEVVSASSVDSFQHQLKTFLFLLVAL